jgi:hypothetical protein
LSHIPDFNNSFKKGCNFRPVIQTHIQSVRPNLKSKMVEAGGLTAREDTIAMDARIVRNRIFS